MNYYLNIFKSSDEYLVAVCDKEILGKTFSHNGVQIYINPNFYGEIEYTAEEVLVEIKKSTSVNAIGKKICKLLSQYNLVFTDSIMWIKDNDLEVGHVIIIR